MRFYVSQQGDIKTSDSYASTTNSHPHAAGTMKWDPGVKNVWGYLASFDPQCGGILHGLEDSWPGAVLNPSRSILLIIMLLTL